MIDNYKRMRNSLQECKDYMQMSDFVDFNFAGDDVVKKEVQEESTEKT